VRVDRQIARVPAAKPAFGRSVLQKITGHPVVFSGASEVLHGFTPIAAV